MGIREEIIEEVDKIIKSDNFKDINYVLNNDNNFLEVNLIEEFYDNYDNETEKSFTIGYIYKNNFIRTREEFYIQFRDSIRDRINDKQIKKDLDFIHKSFIKLGFNGELDNLLYTLYESAGEIPDYRDKSSPDYIGNTDKLLAGGFYFLNFSLNGIIVFDIRCWCPSFMEAYKEGSFSEGPDFENVKFHPKYYNNFINITKQPYFDNFETDSKDLIISGTNLLNLYYSYADVNEMFKEVDFSCLLLPFIKATEIEILKFYNIYKDKLIVLSKLIIDTSLVRNIVADKKINDRLLNFAKRINSGDQYLNSISFLYYLLKYFELGDGIELLQGKAGFFDKDKKSYLIREKEFLDYLEELGKLRDQYIHQNLLMSVSTFEINYNYLVQVLKWLAYLKANANIN